MINYKNSFYILLCMSISMVLGASVLEHIAVWPHAFAAIPKSLSMFQGEYRFDPEPFWKSIHPTILILFIINLIICWKTERKKNVLIPLIGYVLIIIVTFLYFVPELNALISTNYEDVVKQDLVYRGNQWQMLSLIRLCFLIILIITLFMGFTKANNNSKSPS
jgi:hypothetical protein